MDRLEYVGLHGRINGIQRALLAISAVATELHAVREAGFTAEALKYPRSHDALVALCAFNGIKVVQAPRGWHYWPNPGMKACWERVLAALREEWMVGHFEHLLCEARDVIRKSGGGDAILNEIDEALDG